MCQVQKSLQSCKTLEYEDGIQLIWLKTCHFAAGEDGVIDKTQY